MACRIRDVNADKTDQKGFRRHLAAVLKEMCRRVKAKYGDINFKSQDWFRAHKWTREQEHNFEDWMTDYLYKDRSARHELLELSTYANKTRCRKAAQEFTFMYGWSLSDLS